MAVRFDGNVHLFQLEVVEMAGEGAAMAQLKARRYTEKHRGSEEPIHVEPTRPEKIDQGANAPWTPLKRQRSKDKELNAGLNPTSWQLGNPCR